mmetsp:Transcript_1288/g.2072  ORF Transcript_1288/g.2072 Transcript_1288/m.2072 type:complete len:651 (-) Transcript_1288:1359-3311(-)
MSSIQSKFYPKKIIYIEGCAKPVAVKHLAKNMVPQAVALKKRKHQTSPAKHGHSDAPEKRVVAHYLGIDRRSSSAIPSWAAVSVLSLKKYRANLEDVLRSCKDKVARSDWMDLICAMEEASAALGDASIRPKILLKKLKNEKTAVMNKKIEQQNQDENEDARDENEMKLSHTPEYFDDWKTGSVNTQSQSQMTMSQGGARFSQGVISLLDDKTAESKIVKGKDKTDEADEDKKQQTKDDSNESNENSKVQPEKSLESTNQEKKDEIQKHATLATEETTTVNVSVASTSDISTSQEKKRAFLVEGVLRPPRRAIMSQTYTGTAIEKKTVSIQATPEKIHIKSGMLQNEKDTPFSSLSQMYVCNIDASVQHKNEVHLQSNKLSVPTNSPDHMCSHDSIDEEKSASDTRSKDVNELGGQSSVDDVNMLSATINNTSKNEVSLEIHKAIDAKHVLCEPTPSQNNAAEILLQICHPYQSTTSSLSMLRGNISSNEIINHNMMAEDKMDLVDESVIKERMGVDPSASEMASTHLQDVENTSSCISPTPKKAPIQGKDEEIETNKSNNSGQAIISTPLPSHRSPSADHALDHGADFIGKNYASAKTIVTPSPAAASMHKNEYFTSINRTQPRQYNSTSKVPPQTIKNNNEGGLLTQA